MSKRFTADRPYSDLETAARKLLEIANAAEATLDGRIHIEKINAPFLFREHATPAENSAGLKLAIERGWLVLHDSGHLCEVHAGGCGSVCLIRYRRPIIYHRGLRPL